MSLIPSPLRYQGVTSPFPPNFIRQRRAPTIDDNQNVQVGDLWLWQKNDPNQANNVPYMLVALVKTNGFTTATWIPFTTPGGDLTTFHTDGADATIALGAITIRGIPATTATYSNITTSGAGAVVTVNLNDDVTISGSFASLATANIINYRARNSVASVNASSFSFQKDRVGAIVQNGDGTGTILFSGWDGAALQSTAAIQAVVSGAPAAGVVPQGLVFSTGVTDSASLTARVVINEHGNVAITAPSAGNTLATLTVAGDGTEPSIRAANSIADGTPAVIEFVKERAGAIVQINDGIGLLGFSGFDGVSFISSSFILSRVDVAPGLASVPCDLQFWTGDGATTAKRLAISSAGTINVPGFVAATEGVVVSSPTGDLAAVACGAAGTVLTSNGAAVAPSFQAASGGGGIGSWIEVIVMGPTAMAVKTGYIANNPGLVSLLLPAVAVVGDVVRVAGKGAGGWSITQNAGQTIHTNIADTTVGVGGSLSSTNRYDAVELLCITANTDWLTISEVGNLTGV